MLKQAVKTYRKRAGLSQDELAAKVGIARNHLSHIETGRIKNPRFAVLLKLSAALGCSVEQLMAGKPPKRAA